MLKVIVSVSTAVLLIASCSTPALDRLPEEYVSDLRELGLIAVYPPRADFRVGAVFFRAYDPENIDNPLETDRFPLGHVPYLRLQEALNAVGRPALNATAGTSEAERANQSDFSANLSSNGVLRGVTHARLEPVGSPIVTAYGGGSIGLPFLGIGTRSTVYLQFMDARRSSVDITTLQAFEAVLSEFSSNYCARVNIIQAILRGRGIHCQNAGAPMSPGLEQKQCDFVLVTEALYTRDIDYVVTNAVGVSAAETGTTAIGEVTVDVAVPTEGAEASLTNLGALIQGLTQSATPTSNGVAAAAAQGTQFSFSENFPEPVAFAYDGITFGLNQCGLGSATSE